MLFTDVCVCTFQPRIFTGRGSERVNCGTVTSLEKNSTNNQNSQPMATTSTTAFTAWMNVASTFFMAESEQCSFLSVRGVDYSH